MDDDLRQKAQDVFAALAVNGASFTEFLDTDFSSWRVFFRAVKDFAADQSTALAALANAGFLSRHEISVANWGKSVKERSPLFKEEFEKFIALEEVREALAKDLGVAPPPPPSPLAAVRPAASPLADKSNATFASPAPSAIAKASTSPKAAEAEVEAAPPAEPPVVAPAPPNGAVVQVELDVSQTHVSVEHHRERVLAYLGGFRALLLDLQERVDEIATSNVMRAGEAVEKANARIDQALERLEVMVEEESGAARGGEGHAVGG